MSAAAVLDKTAFEAGMSAVIIYDDRDVAARAKAAVERAVERADSPAPWSVDLWRLEMLSLPSTADAALTEAVAAHLVVLGVKQTRMLPAWLLDWLEQWATRRKVQDAALALFDSAPAGRLSAEPMPGLSRFAERHGLSFIFADARASIDNPIKSSRGSGRREPPATPALRHTPDKPLRERYRHDGLNE